MKINNKNYLEKEKKDFIVSTSNFLDSFLFTEDKITGRPKIETNEILKHLLVMSYNGMSYRRALSDLEILLNLGYIKRVIPRSTLNDYANKLQTIKLLEELIKLSALFFKDEEDTLIVDSSWFGEKMYTGGHSTVHGHKQGLIHTRKIHIGILQNSKVICYAKATAGTFHDCPAFKEILLTSSEIFNLKKCLGDKGYCSKENYRLCEEREITAFLDFKKNYKSSGGKSMMWRQQITICRENPNLWHDSYRFRVLVESVFSVIKKKYNNYLRSRNEVSRDVEMLLKCLVYNLSIIGRRF